MIGHYDGNGLHTEDPRHRIGFSVAVQGVFQRTDIERLFPLRRTCELSVVVAGDGNIEISVAAADGDQLQDHPHGLFRILGLRNAVERGDLQTIAYGIKLDLACGRVLDPDLQHVLIRHRRQDLDRFSAAVIRKRSDLKIKHHIRHRAVFKNGVLIYGGIGKSSVIVSAFGQITDRNAADLRDGAARRGNFGFSDVSVGGFVFASAIASDVSPDACASAGAFASAVTASASVSSARGDNGAKNGYQRDKR